jgi:hypothetical protein
MAPIDVRLRPEWVEGAGYRYDVLLGDEVIVSRSRDPEHDTARALHARGFRGKFRTIDFTTGKPRMIVDIVKASRLRVVERDDGRMAVEQYRPMSESLRHQFGAHTSGQERVEAPGGMGDASQPADRAVGETCARPLGIPELA